MPKRFLVCDCGALADSSCYGLCRACEAALLDGLGQMECARCAEVRGAEGVIHPKQDGPFWSMDWCGRLDRPRRGRQMELSL